MILRLTEGSLSPVDCVEGGMNSCGRAGYCAANGVWRRLNDAINGVVDSITLEDMVNDYKKAEEQAGKE